MARRLEDQTRNPLELGVEAGASKLRRELGVIESVTGEVAPLGKRPLTRREKLLSSLATPASQWAPDQAQWVLREMMRLRNGNRR